MVEEAALAQAGLRHLNALTAVPDEAGVLLPGTSDGRDGASELTVVQSRTLRLRVDGLHARFLQPWRISWS